MTNQDWRERLQRDRDELCCSPEQLFSWAFQTYLELEFLQLVEILGYMPVRYQYGCEWPDQSV